MQDFDFDQHIDDVESLLAQAFIQIIEERAVDDFLATHDFICPHCGEEVPASSSTGRKRTSPSSQEKEGRESKIKQVDSEELAEAKELLQEVSSWSDEEIEQLPQDLQEKAQTYQDIL